MSRTDILMTAPMMPIVIETLEKASTLHRLWEQADKDAFLKEVGPRIRGVATSTLFGRVDATLLDRLPNAEIISSFGVGYDNVDAAEAAKRDIVVTNTPGVLDDEVADLTLGLLLATLRKIRRPTATYAKDNGCGRPFPSRRPCATGRSASSASGASARPSRSGFPASTSASPIMAARSRTTWPCPITRR